MCKGPGFSLLWIVLLTLNLKCINTSALTHTRTPTRSQAHTQTHTLLFVSTDVKLLLLAYLHCGGPPSAGLTPVWWPTCGKPHGHAPSLPHPAGPSRGARWKTLHYQCGSDLPGKKRASISTPLPPSKGGNSTAGSNYSALINWKIFEKGLVWRMTQVDTIWGPSITPPGFIGRAHEFTLNVMIVRNVCYIYFNSLHVTCEETFIWCSYIHFSHPAVFTDFKANNNVWKFKHFQHFFWSVLRYTLKFFTPLPSFQLPAESRSTLTAFIQSGVQNEEKLRAAL